MTGDRQVITRLDTAPAAREALRDYLVLPGFVVRSPGPPPSTSAAVASARAAGE